MKKILVLFIILIIIIGIILLIPQKVAVLTYHDFIVGKPKNSMQKNIKEFEKEMIFLKKHHYKTLTLKEMECFINKKCKIPRKSVLITMDDGWKSEYELALPILKKYNLNATIFYIGANYNGSNSNFINKNDIKIINKKYKNIEVASHTFNNHTEDGYKKSEKMITQDLKQMDKIITKKYFAYPYGKYSDNYIKSLKKEKYKLAFTFGPHKEHRKATQKDNIYKIPRYNVSTTYPYYKFIIKIILPV